MQSILFRVEPGNEDALTSILWQHGTAGIIDEGSGWRAFFEDNADIGSLLETHAGFVLERRQEKKVVLQQFERNDWDGILVGKKFFVAPSWASHSLPPGRFHLAIDAVTAFGTGRHESTQLAIEALETHLTPGATVVDIGCGSGILSAAATLLGAGQVVSCDLDAEAIRTARQHIDSPVFLGTADAIHTASADIAVVNISAHVIDSLAVDLNRILKPNGLLVLTGFIDENTPRRFRPQQTRSRGDWQCWICPPDSICPDHDKKAQQPSTEWWDNPHIDS